MKAAQEQAEKTDDIQAIEVAPVKATEQEVYTGVEMRDAIGSIIMQHTPDIESYKKSLEVDLEQQKEKILQKQFNDQDVLRLVQTKKKLSSVLTKLDGIIADHNWS